MGKLEQNLKTFKHELNLLKKRIKTAQNKGYIFEENIIPKIPEKVYKKDISKIKKLRGESLRKKASGFANLDTGEFTSKSEIKKQPKPSKTRAKYEHEINLLKERVKLAESKGFVFNDDIIPKAPNKVTKSDIESVQKLKRNVLRRKAKGYKSEQGGNIVSPEAGIEKEKQKTTEKAKKTKETTKDAKLVFQTITDTKSNIDILGQFPELDISTFLDENGEIQFDKFKQIWDNLSESERTKIINTINESHDKKEVDDFEQQRLDFYQNSEFHDDDDYSDIEDISEGYNILEQMQEIIDNYVPLSYWTNDFKAAKGNAHQIVSNMLSTAIQKQGKDNVAKQLQKSGQGIISILESILYDSEQEGMSFDIFLLAEALNLTAPISLEDNATLTDYAEALAYELGY